MPRVTPLCSLPQSLGTNVILVASDSWRRWGPLKLVSLDIAGIFKHIDLHAVMGCTDSLKLRPGGSTAGI